VITYSEYQYYPLVRWTPDETAVIVVIPPEDPFVSSTARVWRVPLSGTAVPLLDLTGFSFFRNQRKTQLVSPDASKVAFLRETAPNNFDLVVTPLDGSPESVYASGDITWAGWNPDATRVVYGSSPANLNLVGPSLASTGLGFGRNLRWISVDSYLYLNTITATHRFGRAMIAGPETLIDDIAGQIFDYDYTQ
jgi:hypothetical protein